MKLDRFLDRDGLPILDKDMSPHEIRDLYFAVKAMIRRAFIDFPPRQLNQHQRDLLNFLKDHSVDES